jgi:hypothetical protein
MDFGVIARHKVHCHCEAQGSLSLRGTKCRGNLKSVGTITRRLLRFARKDMGRCFRGEGDTGDRVID